MNDNIFITIQHGEELLLPVVKEKIKLVRELGGKPSTLSFSALKDDLLSLNNGDRVKLSEGNKTLFTGYIFELKQTSKEFIQVICYDQLRYLKNKRSYYLLKNKTATEIIKMIADDFQMKCGALADTGYNVGLYISDNQSLIDLIYYYIYTTKIETGALFELYDEGGSLRLENVENMGTSYLLNADNLQDYTYTESIDKATYNVITLVQSAKDSADGKRKLFYKSDSESIAKWGRLEYTATIEGDENGNEKASNLLKRKNKETKYFTAKGAFGDTSIRGGSLIACDLNLHNRQIRQYMIVRKVVHKFENGAHFMDLVLIGGDLNF